MTIMVMTIILGLGVDDKGYKYDFDHLQWGLETLRRDGQGWRWCCSGGQTTAEHRQQMQKPKNICFAAQLKYKNKIKI